MKEIVLDASVAAKWFLPAGDEHLVTEALRLFEDYKANEIQIAVPDLFWAEFGNIAWKALNRQRWLREHALHAIGQLKSLDFTVVGSKELLESAFEISSAYNRSMYDATYVALARARSAPMVTADERLANALGTRFPVRWLGSFSVI